ncbi:enoyl-CoA hydratase/isomerase family protein [Halioxenophilus aromaticivorans]|uniref:2-(1,2-epoxy-1,2-dihydrophenyl)acetyl-CoA isomerase PaaG n=1 Tax=Halioxenophilus aromaticivorans TaxID=1306992 RepID=A0AAV3U004_9ALTE
MLAFSAVDEEKKIGTVTINRPEALNALNLATAQALQNAFAPLQKRLDLRCVVIKGNGPAFMAGGDVEAFAHDFSTTDQLINGLLDALCPVVEFIYSAPFPVVACVHGAVAGAGLSLMAACDLAFACENTKFLLAYDKVGAPPDCGGSFFLPQVVGRRRAASLMYMSEAWSSPRALENGLINKIVNESDFEKQCHQLVAKIAEGPTSAYAAYKKLVNNEPNTLKKRLKQERLAFCAATKTQDFQAGVSAFIDKTQPNYPGK